MLQVMARKEETEKEEAAVEAVPALVQAPEVSVAPVVVPAMTAPIELTPQLEERFLAVEKVRIRGKGGQGCAETQPPVWSRLLQPVPPPLRPRRSFDARDARSLILFMCLLQLVAFANDSVNSMRGVANDVKLVKAALLDLRALKALSARVEQMGRQVADVVLALDKLSSDNIDLLTEQERRRGREQQVEAQQQRQEEMLKKQEAVLAVAVHGAKATAAVPIAAAVTEKDVEHITSLIIDSMRADGTRQDSTAAAVRMAAVLCFFFRCR